MKNQIKPIINQSAWFYCHHCKKKQLKPVGLHFEYKGTWWSSHANTYTHRHGKIDHLLECIGMGV